MPKPVSPEHAKALWMLLLANFFWGLSFPVIKAVLRLHEKLVPEAGAWFSSLYTVAPRFLLAALLIAALRPREFGRATHAEWKQGLILGLFAAVGMLLQNDALHYTEASTSAFLTQVSAILIPIWVALWGRRNPGLLVWCCCLLVLAGVAILGQFDWNAWRFGRGEWETMLSALFFMVQILTLDRKDFAGNRPLQITGVMFATEAIIFCVLAVAIAPNATVLMAPWTSSSWLGFTAILTILCTLGSFSLMNAWQPKITATEAGLIYCIEPIFASVMALFLPGMFSIWAGINYANETATWPLLIGGALITLANVLLQRRPPIKE
jgi:drug/metabolite transporter (DMT)-like permease